MEQDAAQSPLLPRRVGGWLTLFGPGAIIASLTIGSGELVFSSRGGALFGYRLLGLFVLICLMKWALVFATARHLVLTGAHPFQRWMDLPGPRGWLPIVFLVFAVMSFPVWVGFHAGTVGTLIAALTGTQSALHGGSHFVWGVIILVCMTGLVWTGGYARLERIQLVVVFLMLGCVVLSLALLRPDWQAMLQGLIGLSSIGYPDWIDRYPQLESRPLWVELVTYVGVIGGSGYDYLAYVSFLREKRWGAAAGPIVESAELDRLAEQPTDDRRRWVMAPMIDAAISFAIVFAFAAVFLACGAEILQPRQQLPGGSDLLTLQAEFVGGGRPAFRPIYFAGALLAMLGTLYGTIEVAPAVIRELVTAFERPVGDGRYFHRRVTGWVAFGGALVLLGSLLYFFRSGNAQPPQLIGLVTPANLFTGVLACGIIALLSLWMDRRWLPSALRSPWPLRLMNLVGGMIFLALGIKAYWDHGGLLAMALLTATLAGGWLLALVSSRQRRA